MKKPICALLSIVLLLACAACGGTLADAQVSPSTDTPAPSASQAASESPSVESTPAPSPVPSESTAPTPTPAEAAITEELAYEGVGNYCRDMYSWNTSEEPPATMYLTMGEETENEYQVIFRSYTGAFVYFYVDKSSGTTRLVESVPTLGIEEDAGTIELYDYLGENSGGSGKH